MEIKIGQVYKYIGESFSSHIIEITYIDSKEYHFKVLEGNENVYNFTCCFINGDYIKNVIFLKYYNTPLWKALND